MDSTEKALLISLEVDETMINNLESATTNWLVVYTTFYFSPFSSWLANYGHVTISGIVAMLFAHDQFKYIKMFRDLSFHCILHKTTPMSKTPCMQWDPLQQSADVIFPFEIFLTMLSFVSSVLIDQADLPRRHLHNLGVVGQGH